MIIHRKPQLERLEGKLQCCEDCVLGKTKTHLVFGRGSEHAGIVFIGEGQI